MIYLNIFEPIIILVHDITFTCSPVDRVRFQQDREILERDGRFDPSDKPEWTVLLKPIELIRLIKRYHKCGNGFVCFFVIHLSYLAHITIKCAVHTFYTGSDRVMIEYFDTIYYPHLLGVFPKPYLFNNLFLALSLFFSSARFLAASRLIRGAIVNAKHYREIRMSQLNLAYLTSFNMPLRQWWIGLFEHSKHLEMINHDQKIREKHFSYNSNTEIQSRNLSNRDMRYQLNMVDFGDCYYWIGDTTRPKAKYKEWHFPTPLHRVPNNWTMAIVAGTVCGLFVGFISPLILCAGVLYLEFRSSLPAEDSPTLLEVAARFSPHLSRPLHVLRITELLAYSLLMLPHNFDAALLYTDIIHLVGRVGKLTCLMKKEKEFIRDSTRFRLALSSHSLNQLLMLNHRLQHEAKITRALYTEFIDLKIMHSLYINLVLVGSGICIAYIVSLKAAISTTAEVAVLSMLFVTSLIPIVSIVSFCAWAERTVS